VTDALILGRREIAKRLGVCVTTLKKWGADPMNPTGKYLSRVGGRIATSERELQHLRDELLEDGALMGRDR
jgi:hypothetical protein